MKIHFKSVYGPEEDKNTIEFFSRLEISKYNEYTVLDFEQVQEGSKPIKSKIEYTDSNVIIYSGIGTIELELNKSVKNKFIVDGHTTFIYTHLNTLDISENSIKLNYNISPSEVIDKNNVFDLELKFIND